MRNVFPAARRKFGLALLLDLATNPSFVLGQDLVRDSTAADDADRIVITGQSPEQELPALEASTATRIWSRSARRKRRFGFAHLLRDEPNSTGYGASRRDLGSGLAGGDKDADGAAIHGSPAMGNPWG